MTPDNDERIAELERYLRELETHPPDVTMVSGKILHTPLGSFALPSMQAVAGAAAVVALGLVAGFFLWRKNTGQ